MKHWGIWMWMAIAWTGWTCAPAIAEVRDMRQTQIQAREARQQLIDRATAEKKAAEAVAAEARAAIAKDRSTLLAALAALEAEHQQLNGEVGRLEAETVRLAAAESVVSRQLAEMDGMVRELVGTVRIHAKDLAAWIEQNLQTVLSNADISFLDAIAGQARFPSMEDIYAMVDLQWSSIRAAGQVTRQMGTIIDRSGRSIQSDILAIGNFSAAYRMDGEVGFLTYAPGGRNLYALSRLPAAGIRRSLERYLEGRAEEVPMDISRGGALRQLTHEISLLQQIQNGGPIVWPILAISIIAVAIVVERSVFLWRRRMDVEGVMGRIAAWAAEQKWELCQSACEKLRDKPIARVVAAGLGCRRMQREEMENALQEAILREVPDMERALSTLGMLAAIAPLLGLLGTVTGMIDTFHVITQHGTGDPRMMSGGISEALVTTMLGLSVAIPIMLAHTLLNRTVDNHIGQMEEKAVALVNIVHRYRLEDES